MVVCNLGFKNAFEVHLRKSKSMRSIAIHFATRNGFSVDLMKCNICNQAMQQRFPVKTHQAH